MDKAEAYSPACLSFIFRKVKEGNPLKTGSLGVGCTLDKGVKAKVQKSSKSGIFLNDQPIKLPTVTYACKNLIDRPVIINLYSPLPLGCGFGLSAASTLASLFALNKLFALGKSKKTLAEIAHISEIVNHTGLGSVGTQIKGGFIIKKTAGIFFRGKILPFVGKKIYTIVIGPLETPKILKDKKKVEKINKIAEDILWEITNLSNRKVCKLTLEQIIDYSYLFSRESGLLTNQKVISVIEKIKKLGGHATMSMLGKVVISSIYLKIPKYKTYSLTISKNKTVNL